MSGDGKRVGIEGAGYGPKTGAILLQMQVRGSAAGPMIREDWLRLAWACVDQASTNQTVRLTQAALEAIEDLYEAVPPTLRTGESP